MAYQHPHPLARHTVEAPYPCNGVLTLGVEPSPFRRSQALVVTRCSGCNRIVRVESVLAEEVQDRHKW